MSTTEELVSPRSMHMAWIDVYKGIGILLVVFGHVLASCFVRNFIYLFHMPLFFFTSGYLHTTRTDLRGFAYKKSIHLLVPYVSILLLFYPVSLTFEILRGAPMPLIKNHIFVIFFGGPHLGGAYRVLWFLTCLFLTQQAMNFLLAKFNLKIVAAVAVLALLLSYVNSIYFPGFELPLDANVVCAAVPFFFAGHLWRRFSLDHWWITAIAAAGAVGAAWSIESGSQLQYDMKMSRYGVPFVSFALALCCILVLLQISKLLSAAPPLQAFLGRFGVCSMGIMLVHSSIIGALPAIKRFVRPGSYSAFLICAALSFALALLLMRFSFTRAFLLGYEKDFVSFTSRLPFRSSLKAGNSLGES